MNLFTRCACLVVLALALSGSADVTRLAPDDLAKIRTVAIISAVGQSFSFEKVGRGALEWFGPPDTRYLEISDWNIDDQVTRAIEGALAKRIVVKASRYKEADFSTWDYASLRQQIFLLNDDPGIDAYIVVLRDWHWDAIGKSVHDLQGLGLYTREYSRGSRSSGVFAAYRVVVIDANTGEIYASRPVLDPHGDLPWMEAPASLWPRTPNDLADAQRKILQSDVAKLVDESLPRALAEMKLTK